VHPVPRNLCVLIVLSVAFAAGLLVSGCKTGQRRGVLRVSDEEVYAKHCATCHKAFPGTHFSVERWERFLPKHPTARRLRPPRADMGTVRRYLGL